MNIHLIGIGGIGVSGLALYYLSRGFNITGSDISESEITKDLKRKGVKIFPGHLEKNLPPKTDLLVYSPAVREDNPELIRARELNIPIKSYPEALGELTKEYFTIAISGSHGKSTTTGIISSILVEGGLDPTVIIGTKLKEFSQGNYREGSSEILLIEADEWRESFLNYHPDIIVLTNLEKEHLDYYRDLNHLIDSFNNYLRNLKEGGVVIFNGDDENLKKLSITSSFKKFSKEGREIEEIKEVIKIPGEHNLENALAAYFLGLEMEISKKDILKGIAKFSGSWRRFEEKKIKVEGKEINLIQDYAHHPSEIRATLKTVKEKYKDSRIFTLFQPHQYQRTFHLKEDLIEVFSKHLLGETIITDIFNVAGREEEDMSKKINSKKLVEEIDRKEVIHIPSLEESSRFLKENLQSKDTLVIMGAGDIYKVEALLKNQGRL